MVSEVAFLKGLVRKGKEGFIEAEEPAFEGKCFRPEESVGTPGPVGSLWGSKGRWKEEAEVQGRN